MRAEHRAPTEREEVVEEAFLSRRRNSFLIFRFPLLKKKRRPSRRSFSPHSSLPLRRGHAPLFFGENQKIRNTLFSEKTKRKTFSYAGSSISFAFLSWRLLVFFSLWAFPLPLRSSTRGYTDGQKIDRWMDVSLWGGVVGVGKRFFSSSVLSVRACAGARLRVWIIMKCMYTPRLRGACTVFVSRVFACLGVYVQRSCGSSSVVKQV